MNPTRHCYESEYCYAKVLTSTLFVRCVQSCAVLVHKLCGWELILTMKIAMMVRQIKLFINTWCPLRTNDSQFQMITNCSCVLGRKNKSNKFFGDFTTEINNIIKQCAFITVGLKNIIIGSTNLVQRDWDIDWAPSIPWLSLSLSPSSTL